MKVSYIYWEPWFRGHAPRLDLQSVGEVTPGLAGVFAADVVVVHAPSLLASGQLGEIARLRRNSRPGQVWMFESHESSVNYPDQMREEFRRLFDGEISHRLAADVWVPYLDARHFKDYARCETADREELCCAFISSRFNGSGREEYLAELMRHMEVASYGRLMNNRRLAEDTGFETKLGVLRRFRYTLAFENSIEPDYVTEKFFEPFMAGTVPVYLGAPNVARFAPGANSYIDAALFRDPADLARVLLTADYRSFHAWRKTPLRSEFQDMLTQISVPFAQRFAAAVERLRGAIA